MDETAAGAAWNPARQWSAAWTDTSGFWARHLLLPLCLFAPVAWVLATTDVDRRLSWAWAYDQAIGGFPARHAWWAEHVVHGYGRDFIWLIALACTALVLLSLRLAALQTWRRSLVYSVVAIGLTTALIGGLKQLTEVHCPWDLQGFGGSMAYHAVFGPRPPGLDQGACFPAAHSGSGFALFALYFACRDSHTLLARIGLLAALLTGLLFAFAQEARGAHFLSHDVWSAFIAWLTCLALYLLLRPGRQPLQT